MRPSTITDQPSTATIDRVLAGERISPDDARALYSLPLNELGALQTQPCKDLMGLLDSCLGRLVVCQHDLQLEELPQAQHSVRSIATW